MSLSSILAAIGRFLHILPPLTDADMADNTKITDLTQQLGVAQQTIVTDKATIASLTTDLATSRTNEANAVAAEQAAQTAAAQAATALSAANDTIAAQKAQLDALPDLTALQANEAAQQGVISAAAATPAAS